MPDIIGSVANYLHRHGWEAGQPVAWPATVAPAADMTLVAKRDFKPQMNLAELASGGFTPSQAPSGGGATDTTPATAVRLEEADGDHYWLTFKNFYVITRYNRSPLYAMAVHELSEAILAGYDG
jgi:membrane-bound lytic murein transglycosylase B